MAYVTIELRLAEDSVFDFESLWVRSEQDSLIQYGETYYAVGGTTSEKGLGF